MAAKKCNPPPRTPESRRAEYLKNRKPRLCGCGSELPFGSKKQSCDTCRETPDLCCKKCLETLPLSRFSKDSTRPSGFFPWCKSCQLNSTNKFQNPDDKPNGRHCPLCDTPIRGHSNRIFCSTICKRKSENIKQYGLTVIDYRLLLESTNGRCPICECLTEKWNIDHDHSTGLVTGLVCTGCNIGALANSLHSVERVKKLLNYIQETPAQKLGIEAISQGDQRGSRLHHRWSHSA